MITYLVSVSALSALLMIISIIFREKASARIIYVIWLLLVIRICVPFSLFEIEIPRIEKETENLPAPETEQSENLHEKPPLDVIIPDNNFQEEIDGPSEIPKKTISKIKINNLFNLLWITGAALLALWFSCSKSFFTASLWNTRIYYGKYKGKKVYISDHIHSPCIAGLKPVIYITPDAACSQYIDLILEHEHIHFCHGDTFWAVFRSLSLCIFWWNPLIWAAAVLSKQDCELACDEAVTAKLEKKVKAQYARMIFEAAADSRRYSIGFGTGHIKERMLMITKRKSSVISALAVFLSVISIIVTFTVPVYAKSSTLPNGIDADIPQGEFLDGPNGQKYETFSDFEEFIFSSNTIYAKKHSDTLNNGSIEKFDILLRNGAYKVKYSITAPSDYEENKYPVVFYFPDHVHSYEDIANVISANNCICILNDLKYTYEQRGWDLAEKDLSDISLMIELVLRCDFVDKNSIFAVGSSNGSVLSMYMARTYTQNVCGVVITNPLCDWKLMYQTSDIHKDFFDYYCAGSPDEVPEEYEKRSAVTFANEILCPVMIIDYTDPWYYYKAGQAEAMKEALDAVGGNCTIHKLDTPLIEANDFKSAEARELLWKFIDKYK